MLAAVPDRALALPPVDPPQRARVGRVTSGKGRPTVLELHDLSRSYGRVVALEGLSLDVPGGEVVGFVGPNGAGKTTAMRIALGVLEPDRGQVLYDGAPVTRQQQRRFGYMPEERGLYPKMRVHRHLRYLAALHGCDDAAAGEAATRWIQRLGVADHAGQRVEELSLGNQQRVQLAAALVHDPPVLILDEPFSGLDPIGTDVMAEVLAERAADGAAVIFSSHQLELVERICDRVAIVNHGRMVASGRVDELRAQRARPRLRVEVEGAAAGWAERVPGVQVVARDERGVLLELADGADDQAVLAAAQRAGRLRLFAPARATLAELFREVVAR
jgi:ABC-2 type transport system ATP-binding protein